jgi:hypothetical protein
MEVKEEVMHKVAIIIFWHKVPYRQGIRGLPDRCYHYSLRNNLLECRTCKIILKRYLATTENIIH